MNRFAGFLLTIAFFIITVSGCSSLGRQEESSQPESYNNLSSSPLDKLPDGWSYKTEITHKGSRSEGSIGRLFYRYSELPSAFDSVVISGNRYDYFPMENLWDNSGFIKAETPEPAPEKITNHVAQNELIQGWYLTDEWKIKTGTPSDWFFCAGG